MKSTIVLLMAFVLALSTALLMVHQRWSWDGNLERRDSSDGVTSFVGRSSPAAHSPTSLSTTTAVAPSARQQSPVSALAGPLTLRTRRGEPERDVKVFDRIRIDEIGPNVYVVSAMDLLLVLSQGDAMTATIQPMLSFNTGPKYKIDSFVLEGVLGGHGFVVTDPKLSRRAGIELGDALQTVNGRRIDRDVNVGALLRGVRDNPLNSVIRLEVERQGVTLTKTYLLG